MTNPFFLPPLQPKAVVSKGKKPAPAPYPGAKPSGSAAKKNPLFEKKPKNFGIGASVGASARGGAER